MCVFWAICFLVWLILGALHVDRAANAMSIGKDFNQYRSEFDLFSNGSAGTQVAFFTYEAYDSC